MKLNFIIFLLVSIVYLSNSNTEIKQLEKDVFEDVLKDSIGDHTNYNIKTIIYFYTQSNPTAGKEFIQKLEKELVNSKDAKTIANINSLIAGIYYELSDYTSAMQNYLKVKYLLIELNDSTALGWNTINRGNLYYQVENYEEALLKYSESVDIFEKRIGLKQVVLPANDSVQIIHTGLAVVNNNIALVKKEMNELDSAIYYHYIALKHRKIEDSNFGIAHTFNYLVSAYLEKEEPAKVKKYIDSAEYYFNAIKKQSRLTGSQKNETFTTIGNLLINKAKYYSLISDDENAINIFNEAIANFDNINNYRDLARTKLELSKYYEERNQNQLALKNAYDALEISEKYKFFELNIDILEQFEFLYLKNNDFKNAYDYQSRISFLKDSINQSYQQNLLKDIEYRFLYDNQVNILQKLKDRQTITELRIENKNNIIYFLTIIFVLTLIFLILLLHRYKYKQKTAEILENKTEEIGKAYDKLKVSEEELRNSKKELVNTNATKDKFFSVIAHDLRNPIGTFKNTTDLLYMQWEDIEDSEKKDFARMLAESSLYIHELLEDLLTWSRSQRGAIEYSPTNMNFQQVVSNSISINRQLATQKSITIKNKVPHNCNVVSDPNLTDTILRNLITNAIKYSTKGSEIEVGCSFQGKEFHYWVKDQGIGIPKEKQSKLFSIDSSSSTPGTENEIGTGLGLVIINEFVNLQKGKILIDSEVNKGTKITIVIPCHSNN